MSPFTIKTKNNGAPTQRGARVTPVFSYLITGIAFLIPASFLVMMFGPDAGERCDPKEGLCAYSMYCIDNVCRPSCEEDQDCPEGIRCVPSDQRRFFTGEPIKVCRFLSQIEQSINRSLKGLDDQLDMIRKKTEVSTWIGIELMHKRAQVSTEQFDQYWSELDLEKRSQLTVVQLGQMIIDRHTSPRP